MELPYIKWIISVMFLSTTNKKVYLMLLDRYDGDGDNDVRMDL